MPVRLCTSLPFTSPLSALSHGIDNSVRLATEQWTKRFRTAHLDLLPPLSLDDGGSPNGGYNAEFEKADARSCVRRNDTFGYVGPLNSGATFVSEPILNRSAMLQINPANTNVALTSPNPRIRKALEPATFSHRLAFPTFYRLITTDLMQGPADAAYMRQALHARTYVVVDEPFNYGRGIAGEVQAYATRIGLRLVGAVHLSGNSPLSLTTSAQTVAAVVAAERPDAVFCSCGDISSEGAPFARALRQKGYSGPLVGPDAFVNLDFITQAGNASANSYASNVGLNPMGASKSFRDAYRRRFHVPLQYYDALSYDAANIALHAIYQASGAGKLHGSLYQMRAAVLPYAARVNWHGASGITSFDRNGDTRNLAISMYGVSAGKWRFLGKAPNVTGVRPTS